MAKKQPITWELIEVKSSELKPNPDNPKIQDRKGFKRLQKSLEKFGKVFDGIANKDLTLIDGHSRLSLNSDEAVKVFVPSRQLTAKEYKSMNAIFDTAKAGNLDMQLLEETFDDEFFEEWDLDKKGNAAKKIDAKYPLVPEYDEKHDAIVIICDRSIDTTFIKNALGLDRMQSYKNSAVGESNVITATQFIEKWQAK